MVKQILFFIGLSCILQLNAQNKTSKKLYSKGEISTIHIDANKIFELKITNTTDAFISLEAQMEGEYYSALELTTEMHNQELSVSCDLAKDFQKPNDKLSAHKVYAVTLHIKAPKNIKIELKGDNTQVYVEGNYKEFLALQTSGNYTLKNFSATAKIQTIKGNFFILDSIPKKRMQKLSDTLQELTYFTKQKKVELKAANGFITYSVCKD